MEKGCHGWQDHSSSQATLHGGGARGAWPPLIFRPNFFSKKKKNLETAPPPPYLRVWMTAPTSLSEGLDLPH